MKRKLAVGAMILLLTLITLPVPRLTRAQNTLVSMTLEAGYGGYFRGGRWLPMLVNVANSGAEISGELRVTSSDFIGNTANTYATHIDLPTQSSKQVFLYIPLDEQAQQVRVELVSVDQIMASDSRSLRLVRTSDMLFAVITESPRGSIDLKAIRSGIGEAFQANWRLENIPRSGEALRGLDAIILTDANTGNLSTEQRQAVEDWVIGGGHLIVTGGPNWQKTQAGVTKLLPLQPNTTTTLTSLPSLAAFAGKPNDKLEAPAGTPIVVAQGQLIPDALVLAAQSKIPLLSRRAYGGGYVTYLAVDPALDPFQSWTNRGQLWFTLLTTAGQRPSWSNGVLDMERAVVAADSVKGLRLPDVIQLILFLLAYIAVIGPINYIVLRRLGRRELAWLTIPLIVIVVAVIYYVTGFNLRGTQAIVNRLALVQVWPDGERAQVDGVIGVLAPRRGIYDLSLDNGMMLRTMADDPSFGVRSPTSNVTVYEGSAYQALNIPVDAGTTAAFTTSGQTTAANIGGEAVIMLSPGSLTPNQQSGVFTTRITGTVRNTTGMVLKDVLVLAMGGSYEMGTLTPGEVRTFRIDMRADQSPPLTLGSNGLNMFYNTGYRGTRGVGPEMTIQQLLGRNYRYNRSSNYGGRGFANTPESQEFWRRQVFLQSVAMDYDPSGGRGTNVYVAGWTESSPLKVDLKGAPFITEDTTLYIYRLPVTVDTRATDRTIELPNAFLTWTPTEQSSRRDISPYDLHIQPGDKLIFRYNPMPAIRLTEITEIRLTLKPAGSLGGGKANISLWDWSAGRWEVLNTSNFLTRVQRDPGRFVGPENSIEVLIESDASGGTVQYERLDITLYGRLATPAQ